MDVLLNIVWVLGLGAFIIAAWIFVGAAKRYVSDEDSRDRTSGPAPAPSHHGLWTSRSSDDRRKQGRCTFPITINGVEIKEDRRVLGDRRRVA